MTVTELSNDEQRKISYHLTTTMIGITIYVRIIMYHCL